MTLLLHFGDLEMKKIKIDNLGIIAYALAIIVAILGILVWLYNIEFLISHKNVPEILNKPCAILFLMLSLIFFALGSAGQDEENN